MVSNVSLARVDGSLAIIRGGGRRRLSSLLSVETVEPMLEADRFLLWPLP